MQATAVIPTMWQMNVGMQSPHAAPMARRRRGMPSIWLPLAALLALSIVFHVTQLDLNLQRLFWSPADGWRFANYPLVQFLYHYGTWPALGVGASAVAVWIVSLVTGRLVQLRPVCLFLALVLIIGPGLLINAVFKDHFGRSRPTQATEFGGKQSFRPLGEPGPKEGGRSFPSGHASTGFYWLALGVFFWERRRSLALGFVALGILHGTLMGVGRMAQGGHWASDILWSAGFVYLTAWLLNHFFFRSQKVQLTQPNLSSVPAAQNNVLAT